MPRLAHFRKFIANLFIISNLDGTRGYYLRVHTQSDIERMHQPDVF